MKINAPLSLAVALILSCTHTINAQTQTKIGQTTYDLQTNSSVQNRIFNHGDGTISAVWTYSESYDIAAADRGTGYNFYNGTAWGAIPTARIESEKTGWPNIATTSDGKEVFLSHNIAQSALTQGVRSAIGSGSWSLANVTNTADQVWNRMAIGGANGQTIHHISLYDPFGSPYPNNGVQGQMLYWRSQDGGATYDINEAIIPGLDETNFNAFSGDAYHLAAKGDTVVVVYFGDLSPTVMAKSIDNGTTWTVTTLINAFPAGVTYDANSVNTTGSVIGISDINSDGIADTVPGTDQAGWVLLDDNGIVHVFFGLMEYLDDAAGDGSWTYFPGTNGLMYWNESFGEGPPLMIGASLDLDNNGTLDIIGIAAYYQGLASYPSAGIATNGCIYVSYSAVVENMTQGIQNYRHIYITRSCDGGCSWTTPKDVTPGTGFEENVYGSMARLVDSDIHIVFQQDFEPGLAVNGDEDPFVLNDIMYLKVPTIDYDTVATTTCYTNMLGDSLFCAGDSVLLTAACGSSWLWSTGETTQAIYYSGAFGTVTVDIATACGVIQESKDVSAPSGPPVLTVTSTLSEMCPGDTAELTVTSNVSGTILWSTTDTTPTITALAAGTYSVTVANCGGTSVESLVINTPGPPTATINSSATTICNGDSTTLSTNLYSQASYLWSAGDTTSSIVVDSVGTYTVTVTHCGGTDVGTITLSLPASPVASISGNVPFCSGDSITLTAATQPNATYLWSTGATTQSINVSTATIITLTVTNCAGTDNTSATTAFYGAPSVTVLTSGSGTFCADGFTTVSLAAFASGAAPFSYFWSDSSTSQSLNLFMASQSGSYYVTVTDACGMTATSDTTQIMIGQVQASVSATDPACGGTDGTATATGILGTAPYSYQWNDPNSQTTQVATGLAAGSYFVTITDSAGCSDVASITITTTPTPTVTAFGTNPSTCGASDGSAIATVSGGTPAYTYIWSSGSTSSSATALGAGIYYVTVSDANGCQDSSFATIASTSAPSLSTSTTNAGCTINDGTATVTVIGGTTPYTYLWNDPNSQTTATATGLAAGNYTIIVIDGAGCLTTATATVGGSSGPTVTVTGTDPSACGASDGTANSTTSGGTTPYTYLWSNAATTPSISFLSAGVYSVIVTDAGGCMDSATVSLNSPGAPTLSVTSTGESCLGNDGTATVTATGGTPPYSYLWDDPNSQTNATATGLAAGTYTVIVVDGASCLNTTTATVGNASNPTVIATGIDPSACGASDGTATSTASGGTAPYTYLWSNAETTSSISSLTAGIYSVTVTDMNGCMDSATVSLNSPGAPTITTSSTDASCAGNDGTASASATGGTTPYFYLWNDPGSQTTATAVGLSAGTYFVTLTDNSGCIATGTATVGTSGSTLALVFVKLDVACNGDSDGLATVAVVGGTSPYTYLWSTGSDSASITGLAAGTYSVTATESGGCSVTDSITISEPTALGSTITATDASCSGNNDGMLDLTVSGGTSPYTYLWSNAATTEDLTGLDSGSYSVVVTDDNGCTIVDTAAIANTSSGPAAGAVIGPVTVAEFEIANYSVGFSAGSTYNWIITGGNQSSGGQTNSISVQWGTTGTGEVAVIETDSSGCVGDTALLSVNVGGSAISEPNSGISIAIFPNPSDGKFTVHFDRRTQGTEVLEVVNIIGQRVYFKPLGSEIQSHEIILGVHHRGIYFLNITGEHGMITRKLVLH